MQDRQETEQWRIDAFQIYLPASSCLDPFPDEDVAALSRRFFDNPYDAYAALCNETDKWKAFERAIESLPDRPGDYELYDACIDTITAKDELESSMQKARGRMMQDIRARMEQAARDHRNRNSDRGR